MEQRVTRIIAETDRYRISGLLRLPPEGYRSRLSDFLNASERSFIALTEVEVVPLEGNGAAQRHPFAAVSLAHLVWVTQEEPQPA